MPPREAVNYFGAGPAPLPTPVLEAASKALLNYEDMGIGIAEMSHRSPQANQILADTKAALATLLDIPDDYDILFTQSGGSGQFSAVVFHMVSIWVERARQSMEKQWANDDTMKNASEHERTQALKSIINTTMKLNYLVTGSWSLKASQEAARLIGQEHVSIASDSRTLRDGKFGGIAQESDWHLRHPVSTGVLPELRTPALTWMCDNETVDGVEFPAFPKTLEANDGDAMVVADMSSNFLSRKVDVRKYAVIFGGAQKNIGTTGITIIILRKSLLPPQAQMASPTLLRQLGLPVGPIVLDWPTIAKNNSLYNTLPILDVWIAGQVMQRLVNTYGDKKIVGQEEISNQKAGALYGALDAYPQIYNVVPDKSVRSRMNICLRIKGGDADAEKKFLAGAEERLLLGLKGHRSVGGIRISNYNAVSVQGVEKLVKYLNDFASG
ncbi:hypothetical protein FH972_024848 [Carpinus fangiana]|uniref:phosphoserine transaminase n=1 Tax=Carpinus fangiana TaxID=176857 RepID=A0A5N6KZK5_9ROSI|nr:hypothetical protein FH972_024848 [Carpinus fangiana]